MIRGEGESDEQGPEHEGGLEERAQVMRDMMHELGVWEETEMWVGLPVLRVCKGKTPTTWIGAHDDRDR